MNTSSLRSALLAVAALLIHTAFAAQSPPPPSSGTLVLDFLYPGGDYANNWGLTVSPSGTIYASGIANGETMHGLVLASSDSGSSWFLLDDFAPRGRSVWFDDLGGGGIPIASDSAGNLYVTGYTFDPEFIQPDRWYVRRSTDAGASWTTVDDFVMNGIPLDDSCVTGIAVDAAGDVYVSGWNNQVWTIRKGVGGTSFSAVDTLGTSSGVYDFPSAIFAHPTAGIFAVGRRSIVIKNKTSSAWTVRRSTNGGAIWSNVETLQISSGLYATGLGIGANALGHLYVVGTATTTSRGNTISHWFVRKSTDGGNSWTTVDDFVPGGGAEARRFAAKPNGDLYVAGVIGRYGAYHWIVRKNPGGTGAWTTIDDYQSAPGVSTEPHAIAADASGNVFVGGSDWDGSVGHWLIKKY